MRFPKFLLAAFAVAAMAGPAAAAEGRDCRVGAYALAGGEKLVVTRSDGENLRYRRLDGRSGKLFATASGAFEGGEGWSVREPVSVQARFGSCAEGRLTFQRAGEPARAGRKVPLRITPLRFESRGEQLYGELVLPERGRPKAIVVLQYGSGDDSAVLNNFVQYLLPLKGIGVVVFDKAGTGRSGGKLTGDFQRLAEDMAAAVRAARSRPEASGVPVGLMGESQGGWVAPITAEKVPVDFIVVSYGLAVSIAEEDRSEAAQSVRLRGFDDAAVAKAVALHDAATKVVKSGLREGGDEFERLRAAYRQEPWFAHVGGDYTSLLAATPRDQWEQFRPFLDLEFDLDYDPEPVLARARTPMLWVLAGRDTEAPHEETKAVLRRLQQAGKPIDIVVFPDADHGIIAQEDGPDGPKDAGRHSVGYFDLLGEWIATRRLGPAYGQGEVLPRR